MANGAFNFKNNSGNIVSFISGSGSDIIISGGTLNLSNMTGLTLGNLTMEGTAETASFAPSYLLTSSFNTYSGTTNTVISTLATTGSNLFKGTQTFSGSLIPAVDNTYDLGSVTHQFRDLYLSSASLYIDGVKVLGSTTQELQITTDTGQSFKILEAGSDTITLQSNDGNITLATSGGGDVIMDPTNGIIALKGTTTIYAGNRILSSDGNNIHFGNGVVISGSLVATGTNLISGSSQILNGSGIVSSSSQVTSYGFSTTGSNTFQGTQVVTGSLFISENLVVAGSSSIQHISSSIVNINDNIITVNALNPSVRFGGLAVIDSGSSPQVSGSMLFDSINNQWLFVHQNQGTVTSSVLLMGPETYNNLGNEGYITQNRLVKSTGIEHLSDSNITDTGTKVSINSSTEVTGSLIGTSTATFGGSVTAANNNILAGSPQLDFTLNVNTAFKHSIVASNFASSPVSSNALDFRVANGSNSQVVAMTLNGSGNIGVGTTSPGKRLDVSAGDENVLRLQRTGGSARQWDINIKPNFTIGDNTAAADRFTIDTLGNIGVGTTSPSGRFHVTTSGITASAPSLGWPVHNAELDANARSIFIDTAGNNNVGTAGQGSTVALQLGGYWDSRVVITPTGNGSSSPGDQGTGRGKDLMLKAGTSDNGAGFKGGRLYLNGGIGYQSAFNTNGGDILMQVLTGSGNVGIKTETPAAPLTVRSTGATGILLEQDGSNSAVSSRLVARNNSVTGTIRYDNGGWRFNTNATIDATSGTERALISTDGYFRMLSGTGGVQFGGNTAASNALNAYEEGTWTPSILGATGESTYPGHRSGWYTRVGRLVTVTWFVTITKNNMTGTLRMSGLPFTLMSGGGLFYPQGTVLLDGLSTATNNITFQGAQNSSSGDFIGGNGSTATHTGLSVGVLGTGTMECRGTLTYFT